MVHINAPVCLVTGANSGIGYQTSLALARQNATVILVCRNQQRGATAQEQIKLASNNPNIHLLIADLTSQVEIQALIGDVRERFPKLNVLINNAGAIFWQRQITADGLERTFALNHIAYFILATGLLSLFETNAPARIINVGSSAARGGRINFNDLQGKQAYNRVTAYQQSKLANVLFTAELARRIEHEGISVNCFNPGNVPTRFGGIVRRLKIEAFRRFMPARYHAMNFTPLEQVGDILADLTLHTPSIDSLCLSGMEADADLNALDDAQIARQLWNVSENLMRSGK